MKNLGDAASAEAVVDSKSLAGRSARNKVYDELKLFILPGPGIGSWLTSKADSAVFERLARLEQEPLSLAQFKQLLVLGHQAPPSDDFLRFYWLTFPDAHPYRVASLSDYKPDFSGDTIKSLEHLAWGLRRLYADSLYWWGSIRAGYIALREMDAEDLSKFFRSKRFNTDRMVGRGPHLPMESIPKDDRYLISEMACKSYGAAPKCQGELETALLNAFDEHKKRGGGRVTIRQLLSWPSSHELFDRQKEFEFSAVTVLDDQVETREELQRKMGAIAAKFLDARDKALANTTRYLSLAGDLDVYVATSMRGRDDFRKVAELTESIFSDPRLRALNLRHFDPTLSAAHGHEDKGLVECLMVKSCKVLVLCTGDSDTYGKSVEAAMALSFGKPVIFLCDQVKRLRVYKDLHPLSRLIDFKTGVAVGGFAAETPSQVSELLLRIFSNSMEYEFEKTEINYLRLKDRLTNSVVRLETSDELLKETFWNHYHRPNGC
jgi:hypothetical protein